MATDLQSADGVRSLKLVAAIGNAPIYSALQAGANLSQLSSQFEIHSFWWLHRETSCAMHYKPICFFYTVSFCTARRVLRTLGLLWSSLVVNLFVIVLYYGFNLSYFNFFFLQLFKIGISLQDASEPSAALREQTMLPANIYGC